MKTLTSEEVKKNFPDILDMVKQGEEILVSDGNGNEAIAVIVSYTKYQLKKERPLEILKGKASYAVKDDFSIADEELLSL